LYRTDGGGGYDDDHRDGDDDKMNILDLVFCQFSVYVLHDDRDDNEEEDTLLLLDADNFGDNGDDIVPRDDIDDN